MSNSDIYFMVLLIVMIVIGIGLIFLVDWAVDSFIKSNDKDDDDFDDRDGFA